ncbi:MAG: hypothetical protein QG594_964 [Bacteroidota bacterium]|jgi:5'(3')-deoxyribonucleotidase|nr:hypothetical protein [Bacteroidota bacterium]
MEERLYLHTQKVCTVLKIVRNPRHYLKHIERNHLTAEEILEAYNVYITSSEMDLKELLEILQILHEYTLLAILKNKSEQYFEFIQFEFKSQIQSAELPQKEQDFQTQN